MDTLITRLNADKSADYRQATGLHYIRVYPFAVFVFIRFFLKPSLSLGCTRDISPKGGEK